MLKQILSISTLILPATSIVNISQTVNQPITKLPEKFDQREKDIITSVKDQGSNGICWAYSIISVAEANILKNQLYLNAHTLDLSEKNIAYKTLNRFQGEDKLNNTNFDTYRTDNWVGSGGYAYHAAYSLMQWNKLRYENKNDWNVPNSNTNFKLHDYIAIDHHKDNKNENIKKAVMEHGAVSFSFNAVRENKLYYNTEDNADTVTKYAHAAAIIGWDDNIEASRFGNNTKTNGAWIVKNSWGDSVFEKGYFYLSYESQIWDLVSLEFVDGGKYNNNYYYDGVNEDKIGLTQAQAAIAFQVKKASYNYEEKIKAVNVGFEGDEVDVKVKIYKLKNTNNITPRNLDLSNEPILTQEQHFKHSGLRTIDLNQEIKLEANEWFAIVAEVSNATNDAKLRFSDEEAYGNDFSYVNVNNNWKSSQKELNGAVARIKAFTSNNFIYQQIEVKDLKYAQITLNENTYRYGERVNIKPKVTFNNKVLQENKDYTLQYQEILDQEKGFYRDTANAGVNKITITGKGEYSGENTAFLTTKVGLYPKLKNSILENDKSILYVPTTKVSTNDIVLEENWSFDNIYSLNNDKTEVTLIYNGGDSEYYRYSPKKLTIIKTDDQSKLNKYKEFEEKPSTQSSPNEENINNQSNENTNSQDDYIDSQIQGGQPSQNDDTHKSNKNDDKPNDIDKDTSKKEDNNIPSHNSQNQNNSGEKLNKVPNNQSDKTDVKHLDQTKPNNNNKPIKEINQNHKNKNSDSQNTEEKPLENLNKKEDIKLFNKNYLWFLLIPVVVLVSLVCFIVIKRKNKYK